MYELRRDLDSGVISAVPLAGCPCPMCLEAERDSPTG